MKKTSLALALAMAIYGVAQADSVSKQSDNEPVIITDAGTAKDLAHVANKVRRDCAAVQATGAVSTPVEDCVAAEMVSRMAARRARSLPRFTASAARTKLKPGSLSDMH